MKKYKVTNIVLNTAQVNGEEPWDFYETRDNYVGDYIVAENEQDAIYLAVDYITDNVDYNNVEKIDINYDDYSINFYNYDGDISYSYCYFEADEE